MGEYLRRFDRIFSYREGIDMRSGAVGLLSIVRREFSVDPLSGCLFLFTNLRREDASGAPLTNCPSGSFLWAPLKSNSGKSGKQ